jgi:hypothetical protein
MASDEMMLLMGRIERAVGRIEARLNAPPAPAPGPFVPAPDATQQSVRAALRTLDTLIADLEQGQGQGHG